MVIFWLARFFIKVTETSGTFIKNLGNLSHVPYCASILDQMGLNHRRKDQDLIKIGRVQAGFSRSVHLLFKDYFFNPKFIQMYEKVSPSLLSYDTCVSCAIGNSLSIIWSYFRNLTPNPMALLPVPSDALLLLHAL